jgi:hypothetical protein
MLRLLAHQRGGDELTDNEEKRLESWLEMLDRENAVVAWDPDAHPAVFSVNRRPGEVVDGIPVRRRRVRLSRRPDRHCAP